jgi:hypothetical protein
MAPRREATASIFGVGSVVNPALASPLLISTIALLIAPVYSLGIAGTDGRFVEKSIDGREGTVGIGRRLSSAKVGTAGNVIGMLGMVVISGNADSYNSEGSSTMADGICRLKLVGRAVGSAGMVGRAVGMPAGRDGRVKPPKLNADADAAAAAARRACWRRISMCVAGNI